MAEFTAPCPPLKATSAAAASSRVLLRLACSEPDEPQARCPVCRHRSRPGEPSEQANDILHRYSDLAH
jgi:hypothetical protein